MKVRNPWIDPRIGHLQPEQVQRYLLSHGWKATGPAMDPDLIRYDVEDGDENAPTLFLLVRVDTDVGLHWLIELVGELALWQERYAGDVLSDLLAATGPSTNGANTEQPQDSVSNRP